MALSLLAFSLSLAAQESISGKTDLLSIARPGNPKNWIDIRDQVNISPLTIFTEYGSLFGLGNNDVMKLAAQKTDRLGMTRYKYQQYFGNYRIHGADVLVHERNGRTQSLNGNFVSGMSSQVSPALSESEALHIAMNSMGQVKWLWEDEEAEKRIRYNKNDERATWYPAGELVWSRASGDEEFLPQNLRLCWRLEVRVTGESGISEEFFIDALTGEIRRKLPISILCDAGTGNTAWYGNQNISTDEQLFGSNYELHDDCTGSHDYKIHTKDKTNGNGTDEYEDGDNSWTSSSDVDGVTTHWCTHRTLDYYDAVHNRNSYDDNGHNVDAFNNGLGNLQSNACWGCDGNAMTFGDGPTTASTDDWNSMEVVGHEFTHGVTQESAGLEYEKQSGALNESFSDIFGTVIENWTGAGTFDWTIGEEFGSAIRNMSNPNANGDPDTYKGTNWITTISCSPNNGNDQCGVHTNSGVQNFFFFLLSNGGSGTNDNGDAYSVSAIGITDAADIAYRALTVYLTSTSTYHDAREAWIRAANDLFGSCSDEAIAVGEAWYAVGVGPDISYYETDVCGIIIPVLGDIKYNGIHTVEAAFGCTTTIVEYGGNAVTFEAANIIVLDEGFTVEEGATFYAILDPCNISYWERTESTVHEDEHDQPGHTLGEEGPTTALEVSPSPFSDYFDVRLSSAANQLLRLELVDVNGKTVQVITDQLQSSSGFFQARIETSHLPAGIYLIRGFSGEEKIQQRVVKVK
jgi:Zn-dependent metalloprotease